jgi:hypothetical protein
MTRLDVLGGNAKKYLIVFRSPDGLPQKKVLLKQYVEDWVPFSTVQNEFRGLNITHEAFSRTQCFRVPQPYGIVLKDRILFMEFCPSTNLHQMLWASVKFSRLSFYGHENLVRTAAQIGRLLAEFQKIPINQSEAGGRADSSWYEKVFLTHLKVSEDLGIPHGIIDKIQSYVLKQLHSIDSHHLTVSQHCDFGPWNILIGENLVYLTDFGNFMAGFAAYDLAFFYTSLDLFSRYMTVDKTVLVRMQAAFLEAFIDNHPFAEHLRPLPPLFDAFCIMHMCYFVSSLLGVRMRPYASLYARPPMRFSVEWFTSRLQC